MAPRTHVLPDGHESPPTTHDCVQRPPGAYARLMHVPTPQSLDVVHASPMVGPQAASGRANKSAQSIFMSAKKSARPGASEKFFPFGVFAACMTKLQWAVGSSSSPWAHVT